MQRVAIIGGGFAGAFLARTLERDFFVTLLDTKDYFEFTPSILRTLVAPAHMKSVQVLHTHYLLRAQVIRGSVRKITTTQVFLQGKKVPLLFDYLVLASGSTYQLPIKESDVLLATRAHELREYAHRVSDARTILIVGGGIVGVELACEIICAYPHKKVILVHAKDRLMERLPLRASRYALQFLMRRGVQVLFGERVQKKSGKHYTTDKGTVLVADLAFMCTGISPIFSFVPHNMRDSSGFVRVNSFLQTDIPSIFAAGDVTGVREEKLAQHAELQASIVAHNIRALAQGIPLRPYISQPHIMIVSLGRWHGLFIYKQFVMDGLLPGLLKSVIEFKTMLRYR